MDESELRVLVAEFEHEGGAEDAVSALKSFLKQKNGGIHAAVVIVKDEQSGIRYKDIGLTPARGALGGVVLGAALGILTGGASILLGAVGGLIGGLVGERKRAGEFTSVRMNEVLASLVPGSSAVVAVVEKAYLEEIEVSLASAGGEVFTAEVSADLSEQLEPHRHTEFRKWVEHLPDDSE